MSYEEKGAVLYLSTVLATCAAYIIVIARRASDTAVSEVSFVSPLLWTIGISIAVSIIGRIAVEIVTPSDTTKLDARDKDINRYGEYVGGIVLAIGMLIPFVLTLAEADHFWIANAMFAAFAVSSLVSTPLKIVAYRRGM